MGYELTSLDTTIVSTLTVAVVVGAALYVLFELHRHILDIYAPKLRTNHKKQKSSSSCNDTPSSSSPSSLSFTPGLGQWMKSVSDEEMNRRINLDAWVLLHYVKLCAKLCLASAVFGMVVLWPTYATSSKEQSGVHGSSLYTMAQLDPGSPRLWVPTICCWIFVSFFLGAMKSAYQEFVEKRLEFLFYDDPNVKPQKRFSVMVQNLPRHIITTRDQLREMFEELFPGKVYSASLVRPLEALDQSVKEREGILAALESATAEHQASGGQSRPSVRLIVSPSKENSQDRLIPKPPKVVVGGVCSNVCCVVGEQKDALDYYNIQLTEVNMKIRRLRTSEMDAQNDAPQAFPSTLSNSSLTNLATGQYQPPKTTNSSANSSENNLVGLSSDHATPPDRLSNSSAISEEGIALKKSDNNQDNSTTNKEATKNNEEGDTILKAAATLPIKAISGWAAMAVKGSPLSDMTTFPTTTGFVTFTSRTSWLTAHRLGTLSDVYPDLRILPAPDPEDLIWPNLLVSTKQSEQGALISGSFFRLGLIFWGSLISVVTAFSNLQTLEEFFPFIGDLDDVSYALLAGILPVALMALLLANVPTIISYGVVRLDRLPSISAVHMKVSQWTFAYLLANMFVSIISGSIYRSLEDFVDDPKLVLSFLAESFPLTSVLFCNYLITVTLIGGPNELLQIIPLLQFSYLTKSKREAQVTKRSLYAESGPLCEKHFPFGGYTPQYPFVMTVVLFFWVISPFVPFVAFFFFMSRYFILRHQFLFVYSPEYSLGGRYWFELFYYTMQGLVLFSTAMLFYTSLKQGYYQSIFLFPLPFFVWFQWGRMDTTFGVLAQDIAYARAMQDHAPGTGEETGDRQECDHKKESSGANDSDKDGFSVDYYTQPSLLVPIDAAPIPYRIKDQPLLIPVQQGSGMCPSSCALATKEVNGEYLTSLKESEVEGVAALVDVDFLDDSVMEADDDAKSQRLKYTIDHSY